MTDIEDIDDNIIISSIRRIKELQKEELYNLRVLSGKEVVGTRVYTRKGTSLGYINDIYIDVKFCSIDAFEITDGLIEDIVSGRKMVSSIGSIYVKNEGIFISEEAYEEMIESSKERRKDFY